MIKSFSLSNFKCFKDSTSFDFSRLNLFTGYNGRGKSSVIQALLLLSQSIKKTHDIKQLNVNGAFVNLDLFFDILNDQKKNVSFLIEPYESEIKKIVFSYESDSANDRCGKLSDLIIDDRNYFQNTKSLKGDSENNNKNLDVYNSMPIASIFDNFYYIAADRLGPTKFEEKKEVDIDNPIGDLGQFRLNILYKNKDLLSRVSEEIKMIMDSDCDIDIVGSDIDDSVLSLRFVDSRTGKKIKSFNTGFGYTYILAIVLLLNYVDKGTIFIENPEAHLHPLAQSKFIQLICKKLQTNSDIQIFIETHSEHIINGVRLCTVSKDFDIRKDDTKIYFFDKNFDVKKLEINERGRISDWPAGFFDQQDKDLADIIRMGLKSES